VNRELDLIAADTHETIELQSKAEGHKLKPVNPITSPVLAQAHTAIYKMHRYYARRPHNVFSRLIKEYTNPSDIVLDPFCGGGVTVVEGLKLRRKVVGVDLNPLATWITQVECEPIDIDVFTELFAKWYDECKKAISPLFGSECPKCLTVSAASWFEWSNVIICPHCEVENVLAISKKLRAGVFECFNKRCRAKLKPSKCIRKDDRMIATFLDCSKCGYKGRADSSTYDVEKFDKLVKSESRIIHNKGLDIPQDEFPDMDRARDDNIFGKGIKYFKDFMTVRQRLAMAMAKKYLPQDSKKPNEINALNHLFSGTLRFTNKFVFQSAGWQSGKPIEWAGHNYWLPFQYVELNPIAPIQRRYLAIKSGKNEQRKLIGTFYKSPRTRTPWKELQNGATCWLLTQSSHKINMPDASIDAIITDPPFGGNVQYGELSDFYLVWVKDLLGLKGLSDKSQEAIETRHQGFDGAKDRKFYEETLYRIFKECRRVIKPDGWMVMTFHNRDLGVWMSLHRAALRAGFRLPLESESATRGMVYQPPVENYQQTIHQRAAGSMLGDFILSFKPVDVPTSIESVRAQLSSNEEKDLQNKAAGIIQHHGGADETTLMTGLIPFMHEKSILHRIARYDLKFLLSNGPFTFIPKEKKWFTNDMLDGGTTLKPMDVIPAEALVQDIVFSFLTEHKQATMDELLVSIYSQLVNSHRPQISTVDKVVSKYCKKKKVKGEKRELYVWNPSTRTPSQHLTAKSSQISMGLQLTPMRDHNSIIENLAVRFKKKGLDTHVGMTEQRKSPILRALSLTLSGLELGLPPKAFKVIREIDLIALQDHTMIAAIEVATSISTFNKAINDRFRNILQVAPNLRVSLNVIVNDEDHKKASEELYSPANIKSGLSGRVKLFKTSQLASTDILELLTENRNVKSS